MTQFSISKDNKHILAGYVNLARFNFWRTWLHILNAIDITVDEKKFMFHEDNLHRLIEAMTIKIKGERIPNNLDYNIRLNESKKLRLRELIYRHFPMIDPIMAEKIKSYNSNAKGKEKVIMASLSDCMDVILSFARCIHIIRNFYTHYDPFNDADSLEQQRATRQCVSFSLNRLIVASARSYKLRAKLTDEDMKFFNGRMKMIKRMPIERDDWRFKLSKKVGGKTIDANGEERDKMDITDFGIVWFCSLFLPKKYAVKLFNEYDLLKPDGRLTSHDMEIFREMLCFFRIVIPHGPKLDSTVTEMALALDMLNELRKCPRPLFDTLRPSAQKYFEIDAKGDIKSESESSDELSSFNIRHSDRFPYFALRYFDEMNIMPKIRFHINLGKFRFKFYEKMLIDQIGNNESSLRILQKDLHGFGRLNDIEKARKEKYADFLQETVTHSFQQDDGQEVELEQFISDSPDSKPYVTNSRASYLIDNNRIGLYWDDENDNPRRLSGPDRLFIPDLGDLTERPELLSPKAFLSVRDLQAMVFYHHLQSKSRSGDRVEDIIIKKHNGLRKFFSDISEGKIVYKDNESSLTSYLEKEYGVAISDIPSRIIDFMLQKKLKSADELKREHAIRQLTTRLEKLKRMQKSLKDKEDKIRKGDNKYGKKAYADIRPGRLAAYLTRSILEWQPTIDDGKNKLTGANYRALQAFFAQYGQPGQSSSLFDVLKNAGLLDGESAHPFLKSVLGNGPKDTINLYKEYLWKEIAHIESFFTENGSLKENVDFNKLPFVGANKMKFQPTSDIKECQALASRFLNGREGNKHTALLLPDGLFTDAIIDQLKSLDSFKVLFDEETVESNQQKRQEIINRNHNVSFLMSKYLFLEMEDESQDYYAESQEVPDSNNRYARSYWLFDVIKGELDDKNKLKHKYYLPKSISAILSEKSNGEKTIEKKISKAIGSFRGSKEERNTFAERLHRAVGEVKKNEREIRRYKIQDISVFLMVKDLLSSQRAIVDSEFFRLCKTTSTDLLKTTVTFRYPFHIKDRTIEIVQENMSIKNYPEFRRLLADDRVKTIVEQSKTDEIRFDDLTSELANYDANRSEVFKIIHQLERLLRESGKIDLDNQSSAEFYYTDFDGKIKPLRNNFYRMLEYINDLGLKSLDEEQKKLIIDIRNAFSHNNYIKNIERVPDATDLPNIAREILKRLNEISQ